MVETSLASVEVIGDYSVIEVHDGRVYHAKMSCPECECDIMEGDDDDLECEGCGLPIGGVDCCNFDNGHSCDPCDEDWCDECESVTEHDENGDCTEHGGEEDADE